MVLPSALLSRSARFLPANTTNSECKQAPLMRNVMKVVITMIVTAIFSPLVWLLNISTSGQLARMKPTRRRFAGAQPLSAAELRKLERRHEQTLLEQAGCAEAVAAC